MPICAKCNLMIKPASLAVSVGEDSLHPACIYCSKCETPLYGKAYRKTKNGKLECQESCSPNKKESVKSRPPSAPKNATRQSSNITKPYTASLDPQYQLVQQQQQNSFYKDISTNGGTNSLSLDNNSYRPTNDYLETLNHHLNSRNLNQHQTLNSLSQTPIILPTAIIPNGYQQRPNPGYFQPQPYLSQSAFPSNGLPYEPLRYMNNNKLCRLCNKSVINKRFITLENGDVYCNDCFTQMENKFGSYQPPLPKRIPSAQMFVCSVCNKTIADKRYITEANGRIVCDSCETNAERCSNCNQIFKYNEMIRSLPNGLKYHDYCFNCSQCNKLIESNEFYLSEDSKKGLLNTEGEPVCKSCFESVNKPKCFNCSKPIDGIYFMLDNNKPVHEDCFKCSECKNTLDKSTGYFKNPENQLPICYNCNIKKKGIKCSSCMKTIEKDGIRFSDKDYHQECFRCDKCGTDLTKMKKTLTDKDGNGKICDPCFIKDLAPKCAKCNEPISPYLPGTQYEDKQYHKECFSCARCKRSLADKKFYKSGTILICENCY